MGQVHPMPGDRCAHNARGRCLLELRRNAERHSDWKCHILNQWDEALDQYLEKADIFEMEPETAARVWGRRFKRLAAEATCARLRPGNDDTVGCLDLYEDLCLNKIPPCPGRCPHYEENNGPGPSTLGSFLS